MRTRSNGRKRLAVAAFFAVSSAWIANETVLGQPITVPPGSPAAWGGYTIEDTIPNPAAGYTQLGQPGPAYTLPAQVALPPQSTVISDPDAVWQTFPGPGGMPMGAPSVMGPPIAADPLLAPPGTGGPPSLLPPGTRNGVFQKAKFTATWLPQLDNDGLGWTDLRTEVVFGLPFFTRETPIVITPAFEAHFLDRPTGYDLPPRLYDLSVDFHHFRRIGDHWIADFAVTPGLYGDDYTLDASDAFRVNGRAVGVYEPNQMWKWLLGVSYVNGGWAKIVPIAGFVYEPNDDVEYEAVFPAPRAAWRLPNSPVPGQDEYWVYVAGEFTSSIWAFEQFDGTGDILSYRDLRLILGLEHKVIGGLSSRAEIGYVFRREMKIASLGDDDIDLNESLLLRLGLVY